MHITLPDDVGGVQSDSFTTLENVRRNFRCLQPGEDVTKEVTFGVSGFQDALICGGVIGWGWICSRTPPRFVLQVDWTCSRLCFAAFSKAALWS
jgi:hypothetical protein